MSDSPTTSNEQLTIKIRRAHRSELPLLVSMQQQMSMETENRELKTETITRGLQRAFDIPQFGAKLYVAYVAYAAGDSDGNPDQAENPPIAMMMNTTEWDIHRNGAVVWFQSVYVTPPFRRRGIFRRFFSFVQTQVLSDPCCCGLRLDVDRSNERAQSTYSSLGLRMEGVRIVRYTKPGVEPEEIGKDQNERNNETEHDEENQNEVHHQIQTPLPPLNPDIRIRRVTSSSSSPSSASSSSTTPQDDCFINLIDKVAKMQFESSTVYYPTSFPASSSEGGQKTLEKTKQGLLSIFFLGGHDEKQVGAELYVAELVSTGELLGSVVLTFEWSDWRDGIVLSAFGTFAVDLSISSKCNENPKKTKSSQRCDCFRSFFRAFKQRALSDADVCGVRFSYEEAVEAKLDVDSGERIDFACVEEGMFVERYYLMRYDK